MQCAVATTADQRDDAELVVAARDGDTRAYAVIFDRWFDRVFDVAVRIVRNREVAAEVAQDTFLHGWRSLDRIEQPASFGGWLLRTSRNRALNRSDRERRSVALGDEATVTEVDRQTPAPDSAPQHLERQEMHDLVWAASDALGDRDASVLDLHLRHGLDAAEIAEALDITTNNAHQLLFRLKARLGNALRAFAVWHRGKPTCAPLAAALAGAGVVTFGAAAVTVISRHVVGCAACTQEQSELLAPERLFAAAPIIAAGPLLKAKAAAALETQLVSTSHGVEPTAPSAPVEPERPVPPKRRRGRRVASALFTVLVAAGAVYLGFLAAALTGPRPSLEPVVEEPIAVAATLPEPATTTTSVTTPGGAVVTRPTPRPATTVAPIPATTVPPPPPPTTTTSAPPQRTTTTQSSRAPGGP
jgi:RNA polymerase sigma factor (sigma-70 family)